MKTKFKLPIALGCLTLSFSPCLRAGDGKLNIGFAVNSVNTQIGDPEHGSWGYAYQNFNNFAAKKNGSFSFSLIPKYFINDNIALRCELGWTSIKMKSFYDSQTSNSDPNHVTIRLAITQNVYHFLPGIQWNFLKHQNVSFYCGMNLVYLHYSKMDYTNHTEYRNLPSDTLTAMIDDHAAANGGFASGVGTFGGFNIHIQKQLSLGVELSTALLYYKLGGTFSGVATNQSLPNPPATQQYTYTTSSYTSFEFTKLSPSFNITLWL